MMFSINDVVQFNSNHRFFGCFGYIDEAVLKDNDVRYLVGIPVPGKTTIYITIYSSENCLDYVGKSAIPMKQPVDEY